MIYESPLCYFHLFSPNSFPVSYGFGKISVKGLRYDPWCWRLPREINYADVSLVHKKPPRQTHHALNPPSLPLHVFCARAIELEKSIDFLRSPLGVIAKRKSNKVGYGRLNLAY